MTATVGFHRGLLNLLSETLAKYIFEALIEAILFLCNVEEFKRGIFNPSSANFTKWSNTLKQVVGKLLTNSLSMFDHFV